jgi:hypothetical protein
MCQWEWSSSRRLYVRKSFLLIGLQDVTIVDIAMVFVLLLDVRIALLRHGVSRAPPVERRDDAVRVHVSQL